MTLNTLIGFDARTAFALTRMVREETHRQVSNRTNSVAADTYLRELDWAVVKEEISAFANGAAGSGRAESFIRESLDSQFDMYSYNVSNIFAATIAINTNIIVGRLWDGNWYVIAADCPQA
jgi:hypothetical protein